MITVCKLPLSTYLRLKQGLHFARVIVKTELGRHSYSKPIDTQDQEEYLFKCFRELYRSLIQRKNFLKTLIRKHNGEFSFIKLGQWQFYFRKKHTLPPNSACNREEYTAFTVLFDYFI